MQTIDGLAKKVNFSDHASRIIHPLVRVLNDSYTAPELATAILDTLSVLLIQLGADFAIFVPMINKVFTTELFDPLRSHLLWVVTQASH